MSKKKLMFIHTFIEIFNIKNNTREHFNFSLRVFEKASKKSQME